MNTLTYRAMSDMREFEDKKISTIPMKGRRMFRFPRSRIRDIRRAITCSTGLGQLFLLFVPCLAGTFFCFTMGIGLTSAQTLVPPPPPDIPPIISESYSTDQDGDKIDDSFFTFGEPEPGEEYIVDESEMVDVKLIFNEPITQQQIDDFLFVGGEITYIYEALSYGWNGRVPLQQIPVLTALMGPTLVLVERPGAMRRYMDSATRIGQVRKVWRSGFDGDPSITIGIIDSGVDETHRDLYRGKVFWMDFKHDPVDYNGHGSHVAGIAVGTGEAGGKGSNKRYYYTQTGNLQGKAIGTPGLSPINLPSGQVQWKSTAKWIGDRDCQATLGHIQCPEEGTRSWEQITGSRAVTDYTNVSIENSFLASSDNLYSAALLQEGGVRDYVILNQITDPPGTGDEFNKFSGVAPGCKWAAVKDELNNGDINTNLTGGGITKLAYRREALNIKVINVSSGAIDDNGFPDERQSLRNEVNTAAKNGVVIVVAAGNDADGDTELERKMADPARAKLAITVGASNDGNALAYYSTYGFMNPDFGSGEDYKPDLIAPGGSTVYGTGILSVDSASAKDGEFDDQRADDYTSKQGTSMASPFVAGCAALVIDAMQQKRIEEGIAMDDTWDFYSSKDSLFVKMVLCATATETNSKRENGQYNPTPQRAQRGPIGFPVGKDPYEGYGIVNPDAAVDAVYLDFEWGKTYSSVELGNRPIDRRAWARRIPLIPQGEYKIELNNPPGGDFDLYVYSEEPDEATGTPVILYSATTSGRGTDEQLQFRVAGGSVTGPGGIEVEDDSAFFAILVVKRVSGSGSFSLRGDALSGPGTTIEIHVQNSAGYGVPRVYLDTSGSSAFFSSGGEYNGYYNVEVPFNWSGRITPFRSGCSFEPSYFQFNNVMGELRAPIGYEGSYPPKFECQYTGTDPVYIYGSVRLQEGDDYDSYTVPLEGVIIEASNGIRTTTVENGYYILEVPYGWSGTITPKGNLFQYDRIYPTSKTFDSLRYDVEQNFTAGFEFDLPLSP